MESPAAAAQPCPHGRTEIIALWVVLLLGAGFYFWTATSAGSPLTLTLQKNDLYNRLADGFLAGRLGFVEEPPPELAKLADPYDPAQNAPYQRYHDVTYYRGRYYLYFGPGPALVLLAPWKAITGNYLPQNLAAALFAWGAALAGVLLLLALRRRYFPATPAWVMACGAAAVVFGSLLPVLLRRPVYYELAIASAGFFGLLALLLLHRAVTAPIRGNRWLAGASLALGLAIASRPNYLSGAAAALGVYLWWIWRHGHPSPREDWRRFLRTALAAGLPVGAVGLALLAYNHARFDSWTEFGTHYMLAGGNQQKTGMMSLGYVPVNLYYYLLAPAAWSAYFPFVQVTGFPPFPPPAGYSGVENAYGALVTLPFLWTLWWLWRELRREPPVLPETLRLFGRIVCGLVAANVGFLLLMSAANNRYMIDFIPPLVVLAFVGVLAWEQQARGWRKLLGRAGWLAALGFTVFFNVFVSFQHNELLRYHNPGTYRWLAHAFDHLTWWYQRATGEQPGPLRIGLTFPAERTGRLEPLVVTGLSFRADFLYVYYTDDRSIQIGFEHTSYGGPVSKPVRIDYAGEHQLEVQMGSFYPPVEHPCYDGMPAAEIGRRKRTLLVTLDGREVLAAQCDFYDSSPGDVAVGRNPVSEAFGRRFTGKIRAVERLGAP
jgi:hypothetical protein